MREIMTLDPIKSKESWLDLSVSACKRSALLTGWRFQIFGHEFFVTGLRLFQS